MHHLLRLHELFKLYARVPVTFTPMALLDKHRGAQGSESGLPLFTLWGLGCHGAPRPHHCHCWPHWPHWPHWHHWHRGVGASQRSACQWECLLTPQKAATPSDRTTCIPAGAVSATHSQVRAQATRTPWWTLVTWKKSVRALACTPARQPRARGGCSCASREHANMILTRKKRPPGACRHRSCWPPAALLSAWRLAWAAC